MATDGGGALSWASNTAATSVNGLSDALIEDNSMYVGQDPSSTTSTAQYNVSLGTTALSAVIAGDYNTAVGYNTLALNSNGTYNTGLGSNSLGNTTTSGFNTAVGSNSLTTNSTGQSNTGIGVNSLFSNVSGVENTGIGRNSLYANTGSYNAALGMYAGNEITSGTYNTIMGHNSSASGATAVNQTVVGASGIDQADNSVTLGDDNVTANYMSEDKGATVYTAGINLANDETITNSTDGTVLINGTVAGGTGSAAGVFQSNGDNDVTLQTGNSTTGSITITDGANGDIAVAPNGTGETTFGGNPISNYSASTVSITSATTLATSHNGKVLICNSGSDFSLTIPEDTLPAGFNVMIVQKGAGEITLMAASGNVTINNRNSHTKTANTWAIMSLICIDATTDANVFVSGGDGAS